MMHGIIRSYKYERENGPEIASQANGAFKEILMAHDGFIDFHFIDSGDGEGAAVCFFESKEAADASTFLAGGYIHDHLAALMPNMPHIIEGSL
jgi:hypothetical protein